MHPQRELNRLATRKAELVRRLDTQRVEWAAAGARLGALVALSERVYGLWRHFARRPHQEGRAATARPGSGARPWARWGMLLFGVVRLVRRADRGAPSAD